MGNYWDRSLISIIRGVNKRVFSLYIPICWYHVYLGGLVAEEEAENPGGSRTCTSARREGRATIPLGVVVK